MCLHVQEAPQTGNITPWQQNITAIIIKETSRYFFIFLVRHLFCSISCHPIPSHSVPPHDRKQQQKLPENHHSSRIRKAMWKCNYYENMPMILLWSNSTVYHCPGDTSLLLRSFVADWHIFLWEEEFFTGKDWVVWRVKSQTNKKQQNRTKEKQC